MIDNCTNLAKTQRLLVINCDPTTVKTLFGEQGLKQDLTQV